MYYIADGDEETALSHALCSKYNMINVFGEEGLPVSDKHFILASIYLKADNREEALSELARSKAIL